MRNTEGGEKRDITVRNRGKEKKNEKEGWWTNGNKP